MARELLIAVALVSMLMAGCDGAQEQSGEKADNASGAVSSEDTLKSGPAETMGERRDAAAESANEAAEARADALEEQADAQRDAAEQQAEALEQQADEARAK